MRIELAYFSERGRALAERIRDDLVRDGDDARVERCGGGTRVGDWTARHFAGADALVFVGAAGIAVRAVAPHVAAKTSDPAVVCVDETGRYAVSLLSGHIGGANALARRIAAIAGAEAVITTATDRRGVFAIDAWAAERGYAIANPDAIKNVSSLLLAGKQARTVCDFPVKGAVPAELAIGSYPADEAELAVSVFVPAGTATLSIVPPAATLGVGCRRGTSAAALEESFTRLCREERLSPLALEQVCSIDVKKDEPGLAQFCAARDLRFATFSADVLAVQSGDFNASPFVRSAVGVDNVCERAAVAGSGGGRLSVRKPAAAGIAMAVAVRDIAIVFTPPEGECP